MARREQKRFIPKQAIGGLLTSISAVLFLAMLFSNLPPDFWSAAGLIIWLAIAGAVALSVIRLIGRADDNQVH
ncbi:MAG TPA: hypothetical protein VKB67_09455 [Rhizomicrobium sp.]|nr:hypothetical protein [Rhizomicrobium sp.]